MFSISEQNGEKKKVELSLFNNFLISIYDICMTYDMSELIV